MALRLQPLSSRKSRHGVSRDSIYDRRLRHQSRSHARQKNGRRDASRSEKRPKQNEANPPADRKPSRARRRQAGDEANRRVHGCVFVPVLAAGGEGVGVRHQQCARRDSRLGYPVERSSTSSFGKARMTMKLPPRNCVREQNREGCGFSVPITSENDGGSSP